MKKILLFLLAFLMLTSCRSKKVSILQDKKVEKERKELKKDSISQVKNEVKSFEFSSEVGTISEMEIVSDKEKDSVIVEKIRSPTSEKIIVRGGSLKLKVGSTDKQLHRQNDAIQVNNTSVRTDIKEEKVAEKKIFTKEEKKEARKQTLYILLFLIAIFFIIWFWQNQKSY